MRNDTNPRTAQMKADLAAGAADIEAGRIVPGETVHARIQAALERFEAEQNPDDHGVAAALRR
jgi:predicted transcriptional regulator